MKRAVIIVLDSLGIGALPDAEKYGDAGADTLGHIIRSKKGNIAIPNLLSMGIGNIDGVSFSLEAEAPSACFARLAELSCGKDTTTGHWEIAGLRTDVPFKTYPDGFPEEFISQLEKAIGRKTLGNCTASGTEIIERLGDEHEASGSPIIYTSADSVCQIAANVGVIPLEELYSICLKAREMLHGDWACGRVIARPYIKDENGKRIRTSDRRDYSVQPPGKTMLDLVQESGKLVYSVGKISDIFNASGVDIGIHIKDNMDGVDKCLQALETDFEGLLFANLVDFDSKYGHRRDPEGYAKAIEDFDARLPEIFEKLREDDMLIICADHGNDPCSKGTDHTREYVPMLVYGQKLRTGVNLGTRESFADISASVLDYLGVKNTLAIGTSFLREIENV